MRGASARNRCRSTSSAAASTCSPSAPGRPRSLNPVSSARPSTSTRRPSAAFALACSWAGSPGDSSTSGAPRTQPPLAGPAFAKTAPLHLRAEEKGTTWTGRQRVSPPGAPASAGALSAGTSPGDAPSADALSAGAPPVGASPVAATPAAASPVEAPPVEAPSARRPVSPLAIACIVAFGLSSAPTRLASTFRAGSTRHELDHLVELHPRFGQRPGLIEAQHVDAGQDLDGGQLLYQAPAPPQPDHPDSERHAGQQHQPFRDHRDDACHRSGDRIGKVAAGVRELARREQGGHGHDYPRDDAKETVDAGHGARIWRG